MKKHIFKISLLLCLLTLCILWPTIPTQVSAQSTEKESAQGSINEDLKKANSTILHLSQKIYSASLFSPKDSNKLIALREDLLDLWSKNPTNMELAKPFYNTAVIMKERDMYDEAIELLTIVIENFSPTANLNVEEEETEEEEEGGSVKPVIDYSAKAKKLLEKIDKELNPAK